MRPRRRTRVRRPRLGMLLWAFGLFAGGVAVGFWLGRTDSWRAGYMTGRFVEKVK